MDSTSADGGRATEYIEVTVSLERWITLATAHSRIRDIEDITVTDTAVTAKLPIQWVRIKPKGERH